MKLLRLLTVMISATALSAGALTLAAPAQAAPACPVNNFCLYGDIRFGGRYVFLAVGAKNLDDQFNGFGDEASSLVNNSNFDFCTWDLNDYHSTLSDGKRKWQAGVSVDWVGQPYNDRISSVHVRSGISFQC